jgi:molecular chaperone GrpE
MDQRPDTSATPEELVQQPELEPEAAMQRVEELTAQLHASQKRVNELAYALQAGERDREQFKERLSRERERMLDVEKGKIAVALVEAIDQLELSLQSADDSPLARGVKLIREGLLKQAEGLGVERVELTGKPYDPNLAEANDMELTTSPDDDGKVTAVLKPAYQLKGRVIRAGVVRVARYVKAAEA